MGVLSINCARRGEFTGLTAYRGGKTVLPMPAITFKVSAAEARTIRAKARAEQRTVSALIRTAVLPAQPASKPKLALRRHPISGLPYNAAGKKLPAVSLDDIKAALAGFP